ncbi:MULTISPECIES: hypothetical protein [Okeania]|uniref:hypothetical protein n=1 Tax=Okeania TaxID=1458928 RepID=UPI0013750C01|nr:MULTISPECIES: hypothetical protein [Okeania]NEP43160.1 hypothetical protein [Okeania sp. SIO2H7]NET11712.1 hypothetical protein [Okeania sp. SIO1H6]NEP76107.1 hypothetical protein [Okeania sp. SIO2G5]NEP97279.1 hypothetical protein [Okeania sp. SIO2F5]NEQ95005.1 hypothetical protein [Okeania sp. SIO2G4]
MFNHQKEYLAQTSSIDRSFKPAIAYGGSVNISENSPTILVSENSDRQNSASGTQKKV